MGTGVSTFDVRKKLSAVPNSSHSIFSNLVYKCVCSASVGAGVPKTVSTFVPASASWRAGEVLVVNVLEATSGGSDVTVIVNWKPSCSFYGSGL